MRLCPSVRHLIWGKNRRRDKNGKDTTGCGLGMRLTWGLVGFWREGKWKTQKHAFGRLGWYFIISRTFARKHYSIILWCFWTVWDNASCWLEWRCRVEVGWGVRGRGAFRLGARTASNVYRLQHCLEWVMRVLSVTSKLTPDSVVTYLFHDQWT